ncbi:hypothetical protein RB200_26655 [Streptomyces sp. PmtG]
MEGVEPHELPALIGAGEGAGEGAGLSEPMTVREVRQKAWSGGWSSSYDDAPLAVVGRAGPGWSFAFDGEPRPFHEPLFASPAAAASRGGRAVVVWACPAEHGRPALFHLSVAERGRERYAFTVLGERRERHGDIPEALAPGASRPLDEGAALAAIAAEFGVSLPRLALTRGRLHALTTRSWTRPPGEGETYAGAGFSPPV